MSFVDLLRRAREVLRQEGRLSPRALSRELGIDGDELDEIIEELVDIQQVARRQGRAIEWCGESAAEAAPAAEATAGEERNPLDYTPKHLADKILRSKSAIEGERKHVTVFFADVAGSMALAESLDAEDWHRILDRFFQILTEGVHRFEGTVNQYTGDGIMALFGAPIAHEDHAQRACFAALHLRDALRDYTDELRRTQGINLSVRMGINSGEVIVGKIGDDLRMDYTAQGHVVGLAQRMESLAEAGNVYLTEHAARLVSGYFELRSLGVFEIAGAEQPLEVHALEGLGPMRTRLDRSRARGFSKFVGRAEETALLDRALEESSGEMGQVLCVVADAGVGKSRLCTEFIERCAAQGFAVDETHCPAHGRTIPLLPILQLLRSFFEVEAGDSAAEARRKIAGTLVLLDQSFQELLPLVFDFLGVPDPEKPAPELDADARQRQLLEFVRRFVHARSSRTASVILVDDLHWVDPGSDAFVAQLVDAVRGTRTFLLLNYRPEYSAEWLGRAHVSELPLRPLGAEAIAELVRDWLGDHPSVEALPERIRARTGGNPFFTEEVVQTLIESGHVSGVRGAYQLSTPVERIEIPDSVQVVLAARIDRLSERDKRALQSAAVIGRHFDAPLLEAVSEDPEIELAAALQLLEDGEMIHATSLYPVAKYSFKHPLTHEVALESQLREVRQARHARAARALELRHVDQAEENAALLAYHFEKAGLDAEAARWHARAAEWIEYGDVVEAANHWERASQLIGDPRDDESVALAVRAVEQVLALRAQTGLRAEEAEELLSSGRALAARGTDPTAMPRLLLQFGSAAVFRGDVAEGRRVLDEASELTADDSSSALHVDSEHMAAWADLSSGLVEKSVERFAIANQSASFAVNVFGTSARIFGLTLRGWALIEAGRLREGLQSTDEARALVAEWPTSRMGRGVIEMQTVRVLAHRGELDRALRIAGEALEDAQEARNANMEAVAWVDIGEVQTMRGAFVEARAALEEARRVAREAGTMLNLEARILVSLSRAKLGCGDESGALATADETFEIARLRSARHHEAWAHIVRAELLLAVKGLEAAAEIESDLAAAAAGIEETGARLIEPELHLARAEFESQRGDAAACEQARTDARRVLEAMGAQARIARLGF